MKRPFYIIAHRVNDIASIPRVINNGANAIECDVRHVNGKFIVSHNPPDFNYPDLDAYLQGVAAAAQNNDRLALVIFDCKENNPNLAIPLLEMVRTNLTNQVSLNVLISVASYDNDRQFLAPLADQLNPSEGVAIDQDDDPDRVSDFFLSLQMQNHAFGNGIAALLPENPFAPNVPPSIMAAVADKALGKGIRFVYVWTLDSKDSMRDYLRMGVDGIMTNDVSDLAAVTGESEFNSKLQLATRDHNPFNISTLPSYVLKIRTGTQGAAGTDANLNFSLAGEQGTISTTINAKPPGLFERGLTNLVTLIGEDVGKLKKLTVTRDSSGNAPGWFLWDVEILSANSQNRDQQLGRLNFYQWIKPQGATRWLSDRVDRISTTANSYDFGVTDPLTSDEVKQLALEWIPEIRFHENENFHSISLGEWLTRLPRNADKLEVITTRPEFTRCDKPPVFFLSHDWKANIEPDSPEITHRSYMSNISELCDDRGHYDQRDRSPWGMAKQYFGSIAESNNVKLPRITPITTIAEYRNLRQTLFFNVKAYIDALAGDYPIDDEGELLDAIQGPPLFVLDDNLRKRRKHLDFLIDIIEEADRSNQDWSKATRREKAILGELIADGVITENEWRVIRDFVFMEYYLIYAYNDLSEQHPNILVKLFGGGFDHEGDIEGFAVVFERNKVAHIERERNRSHFLNAQLRPRFLMNSAHEPSAKWDSYRELIGTREKIKNSLKVWVMAGSHATVLEPGSYDNLEGVDEDIIGGGIAASAAIIPQAIVPIAILLLLLEHFVLPDEETSDNGVHAIPPSQPIPGGDNPTTMHLRVLTTPLSRDRNIYQSSWLPDQDEIDVTLAERSFPGAWGFDGPRWINKTYRFIQKLAEFFDD